MNREFLMRLAAMARKMGAPPFLQRVLTTFVVRTTLVVEGLAGIKTRQFKDCGWNIEEYHLNPEVRPNQVVWCTELRESPGPILNCNRLPYLHHTSCKVSIKEQMLLLYYRILKMDTGRSAACDDRF